MIEAERYRPDFPWADYPAAFERLRADYAAGLSYSQCAANIQAEFGGTVTRSSVGGKIYRAGLTMQKPKRKPKAARRAPLNRRRLRPMLVPVPIIGVEADADITDIPLDTSEFACMIGELGSEHDMERCRYPLGLPAADMPYCGAASNGPWCSRHQLVVYKPRGRRV